jgi:hypothetical protein
MRNTADVTGGKPIAVLLQSISGVSAINSLVDFYDIHGGKREMLFFYFLLDTTRDSHDSYRIWLGRERNVGALKSTPDDDDDADDGDNTSLTIAYIGLDTCDCV